jgi:hypothetical protein
MMGRTTAPPTTENVGALAADLRARHAEPDDLDSRLVVVAIEGHTLINLLVGRVEIVGLCCGSVNGPEQPWPDDARLVGWWIEGMRNPPALYIKVRSAEFGPVAEGASCPEAFALFRRTDAEGWTPADAADAKS